MLDKLKITKQKFDVLTQEISDPAVIADTKTWQAKVKEHASLQPLMEEYDLNSKLSNEYDQASKQMEVETDPEMKDMLNFYFVKRDKI